MKLILSIIVFFLLVLSACAVPPDLPTPANEPTLTIIPITVTAQAAGTFVAQPSATVTSLPADPTKTPVPTWTAIPSSSSTSAPADGSPTPSVPTALSPDGNDVQCFKGPGIEYEPSYTFKTAEIIGKDETDLWWYVRFYDQMLRPISCWVNTQKTSLAGDLSSVSVTEAEMASVTAVNISIEDDSTQQVACGQDAGNLEFRFSGEIVTNGPVTKLRYQWETSAGIKFSPAQAQVYAWDAPLRLKLDLPVPVRDGTYSLSLRTIYPNEIVRVVEFVVKCQ